MVAALDGGCFRELCECWGDDGDDDWVGCETAPRETVLLSRVIYSIVKLSTQVLGGEVRHHYSSKRSKAPDARSRVRVEISEHSGLDNANMKESAARSVRAFCHRYTTRYPSAF